MNPQKTQQALFHKFLGYIPGFWLRDRDDHTLKLRSQHDLAAKAGMLVQYPSPSVPFEHILLVVGSGRELLQPLLSDVHLALSRTSVDLFEAVGVGINETGVGQGLEEGLAGETHNLALLAVGVDGEELDDAVGDLLRGGR